METGGKRVLIYFMYCTMANPWFLVLETALVSVVSLSPSLHVRIALLKQNGNQLCIWKTAKESKSQNILIFKLFFYKSMEIKVLFFHRVIIIATNRSKDIVDISTAFIKCQHSDCIQGSSKQISMGLRIMLLRYVYWAQFFIGTKGIQFPGSLPKTT